MMPALHEQYRPKTWADVVGQDDTVAACQRMAERGLGGQPYWISGASGVGKTTIAYLLAHEVADDWFVEELDASDLTPARLRECEAAMHLMATGKGGRAYIVNEAHGLRRDTVNQLLQLLERLPEHVVMIFTTTRTGQANLFEHNAEAGALLSRCVRLCLESRPDVLAEPFARRVAWIAEQAGLDGVALRNYEYILEAEHANMRAVIQQVATR